MKRFVVALERNLVGLLHEQFGADYNDLRNFSRKATEALGKIKVVFPGLEVKTFKGGITIKPGELVIPVFSVWAPCWQMPLRGYALTSPWTTILPGLFITLIVLAFNLLEDGLDRETVQ